jgi:hypothetical protein
MIKVSPHRIEYASRSDAHFSYVSRIGELDIAIDGGGWLDWRKSRSATISTLGLGLNEDRPPTLVDMFCETGHLLS